VGVGEAGSARSGGKLSGGTVGRERATGAPGTARGLSASERWKGRSRKPPHQEKSNERVMILLPFHHNKTLQKQRERGGPSNLHLWFALNSEG